MISVHRLYSKITHFQQIFSFYYKKNRKNNRIFSSTASTDAYAILTCQDQEKRSKVATGLISLFIRSHFLLSYKLIMAAVEGSAPTWNETFMFSISQDVKELKIKLMDKDTLTADDYVGEVTYTTSLLICYYALNKLS